MFTNTIFIVLGGGCLTFFDRLEGNPHSSRELKLLLPLCYTDKGTWVQNDHAIRPTSHN